MPPALPGASAVNDIQYAAYYKFLQSEVARIGIISNCEQYFKDAVYAADGSLSPGACYAKLMDFDKNGVEELVYFKVDYIERTDWVDAYLQIYTYANGSFAPNQPITREQSIVTMMRMEWVLVPISSITLDHSEITLRGGQTQSLLPSFLPAIAANGVSAKCKVNVQHENHIELSARLPVTLNCLPYPTGEKPDKNADIDYLPSDPIVAGTITVTDIARVSDQYVERDDTTNTRAFPFTCRLDSVESGMEKKFYPYLKWKVKDSDGKVVDSGRKLNEYATYLNPGDSFDMTISVENIQPGEQYTVEFVNDYGRSVSEAASDEPDVTVVAKGGRSFYRSALEAD